jgi:hypothetical protein
VATERAEFAIELQDQMSGPAATAARALENLKSKINADRKALADMQAAMRNLKGGTGAAASAMNELKDRMAAQKASLASAQAQYVQLGGVFGATTPKAMQTVSAFEELAGVARGLPGPLGAMGGQLAALGSFAAVGAAAVAAVAVAMGALVGATMAATAALLRYGVAQADVPRNELLRLESLTTLRRHSMLGAGNATEMQNAIDRVSDATAAGRGDLERYTSQLYRMGLRGANLTSALEGMAVAGSVQGDEGARRFAGMAAGIARTGGEVSNLTRMYQDRLGPIARRQMLSIGVQTQRLHENLDRLFSGLRIETLLQGIASIARLFSQSTESGRALKAVTESLLQPLIDFAAGPVARFMREFFLGMVFGALRVENALLRLRLWFRETFGPGSIFESIDTDMLAFKLGGALLMTFAIVVGVAALSFLALGAAILAVVWVFAEANAAMKSFFSMLVGLHLTAFQAIQSLDWRGLGASIVQGLIDGLRSGASAVATTVMGLADVVRGTFADALDIRSPSRVFAELGRNVSEGLTLGIEAGAPAASSAAAGLVEVPSAGASGAGAGRSITIGELHIHSGSDDPREHARSFADELAALFEGAAVTMGAAT